MTAADKIREAGVEGVAMLAKRSASVVYRWIKTLETGGVLGGKAMAALIVATATAPHPISWADFEPDTTKLAA